jgi:hypothetical protein
MDTFPMSHFWRTEINPRDYWIYHWCLAIYRHIAYHWKNGACKILQKSRNTLAPALSLKLESNWYIQPQQTSLAVLSLFAKGINVINDITMHIGAGIKI